MKKLLPILLVLIWSANIVSQDTITLSYCYEKIENEFPISRKAEIQQKITDLNVRLSQTGLYPELKVNGSISYQSEVTDPSFAGPAAPSFSKDHYNISLDLTQPIYDAGRTSKRKESERISGQMAQAGFKVELWNIRKQTDQVYFNIILMQKQKENVELLLEDLNDQLIAVRARVNNGVLLPSNEKVIQAEILKVQQQELQIESNIESGYEILAELTGVEISSTQKLELPDLIPDNESGINDRPEFELFDARQQLLQKQSDLISSDKLPVVSAFAKSAYGRPGFDAFNDDLHFYWVVGVKAQWSFRNWNNSDKKIQVFEMEQDKIEADRDALSRQINTSLYQTEYNIKALNQQIQLDEQLLELRKEIVEEKKNLLNQGVITSTEYVTELNALSRTDLNLEIHKVQLIKANYEYLTQKGISWN